MYIFLSVVNDIINNICTFIKYHSFIFLDYIYLII